MKTNKPIVSGLILLGIAVLCYFSKPASQQAELASTQTISAPQVTETTETAEENTQFSITPSWQE
jgi:hypothetical protein